MALNILFNSLQVNVRLPPNAGWQFATHAEAKGAIFEWIDVFYNRVRFHSALGYLPTFPGGVNRRN
jgi:transposase InsO family protein